MTRIVYLHGFASSPLSRKAVFFGAQFSARQISFDALDLAAGDFENLTISGQLRVVENACRGEAVTLMGSSMGGYLAALYAAQHPEVEKLVLLAPAFCLEERWPQTIGAERFAEWRRSGLLPVYQYGDGGVRNLKFAFVDDARQYPAFPSFNQPTLIFHGIHDEVVPSHLSEAFAMQHANVTVRLLDSGHELGDVVEFMWQETARFLGL